MSQEDGRGWRAPGSGSDPEPPLDQGPSADPRSAHAPGSPPAGSWAVPGGAPPPQPGGSGPQFQAPPPPQPGYGRYHAPPPSAGYPPHGPQPPSDAYQPSPYGPGHTGQFQRPPEPKPGIVALRPLNLGDIFNGAFTYIRSNPRATLGLALVAMLVPSAVQSYGNAVVVEDTVAVLGEAFTNPAALEEDVPLLPAGATWSVYGGALLQVVATMILTGLLTMVVGRAVLGHGLTLGETWRLARGRLPAVIGVTLLVSFGSSLLVVIMALVYAAAMAALGTLTGFFVGTMAAVPLLVVAVWLYTKFALAVPAVVLEGVGPLRGLGRSWQLTRGSWWRVFAILLLAFILVFFIEQLLITPFTFGAGAVSWVGGGAAGAIVASAAVLFLGFLLLAAVTTPFVTGVTALVYIDLRMRREGLDLRLQEAARSSAHLSEVVYVPRPAHSGYGGGAR